MNSAKLKAIMELIDQMEESVLSRKKGELPEKGKVKITKVAVMPKMMEEDEDNEDLTTSIMDKEDDDSEEMPEIKKSDEDDEEETRALERLRKRFSGK